MVDGVLARLHASGPEWLVLGDAEAGPVRGAWAELADAAKGKPLTLLFPAEALTLLEVELPIKNNAQLKKALPFALEDRLADDVENYHLVWARQTNGKVAVAAVAHDKLSTFLATFAAAGLEVDAVYPEALCLPYRPGAGSLLVDGDRAIFRADTWQGGGFDRVALAVLWDKLVGNGEPGQTPECWLAKRTVALEKPPFEQAAWREVEPLTLLASGLATVPTDLNLLTGSYARKPAAGQGWRPWWPALSIVGLALVVQSALLLSTHWRQQAELSELEAQTQAVFKQTFPDVKRIVNVKAQADQQLAELRKRGGSNASGFTRVLYPLGMVLKEMPDVQLKRLGFVNGGLQIQFTAPDLGRLELLKQQLPAGLQVKILSADSGANGVEARLEIHEK